MHLQLRTRLLAGANFRRVLQGSVSSSLFRQRRALTPLLALKSEEAWQ